jgi:RNA polymerase sigma-70 factor (ECF subfamily)
MPWASVLAEPQVLTTDENQAFVTQIAIKHGRRLSRYLSARLRNAADVPDLVQEVFLRLLRVARHDSILNPEAYVMTIASHVLHQHTLRGTAMPQTVDAADALIDVQTAVDSDPAAQLDAQRRLEEIDGALAQLSPNAHAAFVLHRRDGLTMEEIAQHLGVSRSMVKKYLVKAVLHCRLNAAREE